MRIGIDIQTLETHQRTRGIGKLCARSIEHLIRLSPEHELVLFGLGEKPPEEVVRLLSPRVSYVRIVTESPASKILTDGCSAPFLWTTPGARDLDVYHV